MYYVSKRFEVSAAHYVTTERGSKCETLHGHNWIVIVHCKSETLDVDGMVTDFTLIKRNIMEKIDHKNLNEVLPFSPTAENLAKWMCDQTPNCYKVEIWESENNKAVYER